MRRQVKITLEDGTRCFRWPGSGDVRGHKPPKGWSAVADLIEIHPQTGAPLRGGSQWWIFERQTSNTRKG